MENELFETALGVKAPVYYTQNPSSRTQPDDCMEMLDTALRI